MTDTLTLVLTFAPLILSIAAVLVAIEAFSLARIAFGRMNELDALIRRARPTNATRDPVGRPPEVG